MTELHVKIALVLMAAIFDAIQDTTAHHYPASVFRNLDPEFWDARTSWQYCLRILKNYWVDYPVDAWHLAKSAKLLCLLLAVFLGYPYWWLGMGVMHTLVFMLFYNFLLRSRKK